MTESQNIEYKSSWRDDYLKWISAFANSRGGKLYIGINDKGVVVGLPDYKRLIEELPNKIISLLGIIVDVNLLRKNRLPYIEIVVQQSSVPISYQGSYYYRTGSTKQELKGAALQQFLLTKSGKTWDELEVTHATLKDIDGAAVQYFITKAIASKRMAVDAKNDAVKTVLQKLNLLSPNGKLTNAALLLFGKNPQRYFTEAYFKLGKFGVDDADLLFQDIVEGPIITMPDRVLDVLKSKYLKAPIRYQGLLRIEELEYPEEALREAILNAIVHKDYTGTSIQLSVYPHQLQLWNQGTLPEGLSVQKLKSKHPSRPRNKNIAQVFFKAGYIEIWGRGISKINNALAASNLPLAQIQEVNGGLNIAFNNNTKTKRNRVVDDVVDRVVDDVVDDVVDRVVNDVVDPVVDDVVDRVVNDVVNPVVDDVVNRDEIALRILDLLNADNKLSANAISALLQVSERTIQRHFKQLQQAKKIKRVGSSRSGYWKVSRRRGGG